MAENNRTKWVGTDARKHLAKPDNGLVEEVKVLRQHMSYMYQAWTTGKASLPPPPGFLYAVLTQTPNTWLADPPRPPDLPAYNSFPNHSSSPTTHHPTIFSQKYFPVTSIVLNHEHPPKTHNVQYYPSEVAHKVPNPHKQGPQDKPYVENGKFVGREWGDGAPRKLKELFVTPDSHLPRGFKVLKFRLYDGFGDPVDHLKVYCSEMRSVGEKDDLMIAHFNKSLTGAALDWHDRQGINQWDTLGDMARDFVRYFQYKSRFAPDWSSLCKMEKRREESFREFGLRCRDQAARVSTLISEEEMVEIFLQIQELVYFKHLIPAMGRPFDEVLRMGELVEMGIKSGKIMNWSKDFQKIPANLGGVGKSRRDNPMSSPDQYSQPRLD